MICSVLAWKFEAEIMCRFTREEFLKGCKAMKVDNLRGIQAKLPELAAQTISDVEQFKELYRFTFKVHILLISSLLSGLKYCLNLFYISIP